MQRLLKSSLLAMAMALWLLPGAISAHPIYVALPEKTMTDHLSASPVVILARPRPEHPFEFRPVTWLKGDPSLDLPPIPQLVDSATRRLLARDPDHSVLFVYGSEDQGWYRLTNVSPAVREMVENLMAELPKWTEGRDDPNRFAFFSALHAHPDTIVRKLALIELVQARYSSIRTLDPQLSVSDIEALLRDPIEFPLAPLFIVMLGLIDEPDASSFVRRMVDEAYQLGLSTNVTAWSTALIEIDGRAGIEKLADMVLGPRVVERKTADAMLTALALHGTEGRVSQRERIAEILSESAEIDAGFAVNAVATLIEWQDWRAAPIVEDHVRSGTELALPERMALTAYLAAALHADNPLKTLE